MRIFLVCPVRTPFDREYADYIVERLESQGHEVHYPPRDTDQTDDGIGLEICLTHRKAMLAADEVWVVWNPKSRGSHFDLGAIFMLQAFKDVPVRIAKVFERTPNKSFGNVLMALDETYTDVHQGADDWEPATEGD